MPGAATGEVTVPVPLPALLTVSSDHAATLLGQAAKLDPAPALETAPNPMRTAPFKVPKPPPMKALGPETAIALTWASEFGFQDWSVAVLPSLTAPRRLRLTPPTVVKTPPM